MASDRRNGVATRGSQLAPRRRADITDSATSEDQCHQKKIFVGGLGQSASAQTLRDYFRRYGDIVDAVVMRWPDGRPRGFGYVTFASAASASAVLQSSHKIAGSDVDVKRAVPGTNKLFVGGLPQNASAAELRNHFEQFGLVSDAVVMMDPATNRSRGFGFVCFSPGQDGSAALAAALEQYDNHYIRRKWIEVKSAAPPRKLVGKEEGDVSPGIVPEDSCGEGTAASSRHRLGDASTRSRATDKSAQRSATGGECESSVAPMPLGLSERTSTAIYDAEPLPTASMDAPPPPGLDIPLDATRVGTRWPQGPGMIRQLLPQHGALASSDVAPLPSLLVGGHQAHLSDVGYRRDPKCGPRAVMSEPMKIPIGSHFETDEGTPTDEGAEFFEASSDLQRSLELYLKMHCGQGVPSIAKEAAV